jgi:hypothetical protein
LSCLSRRASSMSPRLRLTHRARACRSATPSHGRPVSAGQGRDHHDHVPIFCGIRAGESCRHSGCGSPGPRQHVARSDACGRTGARARCADERIRHRHTTSAWHRLRGLLTVRLARYSGVRGRIRRPGRRRLNQHRGHEHYKAGAHGLHGDGPAQAGNLLRRR